jgi:hypothetical protein
MNTNQQFFAAAFSLAFVAGAARAQSEASSLDEVAALPTATLAPALSSAGTGEFRVKASEGSAYAAVTTMERVSDGTHVRMEIAGRRGQVVAQLAPGTLVSSRRLSTGVLLAQGSEAFAFVPNALGRALLAA